MTRNLFAALLIVCAGSAAADSDRPWRDDTQSLAECQRALQANPRDYGAAWKAARALNGAGENARDRKERRRYHREAEVCARRAIDINPAGAQGYMQHGVALGYLAQDTVVQERMRVARAIRTDFEKAVALDSTLDYGWHALGMWHRSMATLGWVEKGFVDLFFGGMPSDASLDKAVACLARAVALRPDNADHRLQLGIALEKAGDRAGAAAQYRAILALPPDRTGERHRSEAGKRLASLE